jgi:hypothetical protein
MGILGCLRVNGRGAWPSKVFKEHKVEIFLLDSLNFKGSWLGLLKLIALPLFPPFLLFLGLLGNLIEVNERVKGPSAPSTLLIFPCCLIHLPLYLDRLFGLSSLGDLLLILKEDFTL